MRLDEIEDVLGEIKGCTFASLDAETMPSKGIRKMTVGASVILFTNRTEESGYANMVKRRLEAAGKDPASFVLSDLPWGTKITGSPLVFHKGKYYLQCVLLNPGRITTFIGSREVSSDILSKDGKETNQPLPKGKEVIVHTYGLLSISAIRLLGEEIVAEAMQVAVN